MTEKLTVRFSRKDPKNFFKTLNTRVNDYFKENKIAKTGNWKLYLKTVIMFSLLALPYVLLLLTTFSPWIKLALCIVMGVGMAGVGMNVMHDGNHGSFSKYPWVNKLMGSSIYILAGNVFNWKVSHNLLHHTYTNIHGHDEDLDAGIILRFTKHEPWRPHHRFQHLYSILLYGLLTLNWALFSDFPNMYRFLNRKLSYGKSKKASTQWIGLILTKMLYWGVWIVIPILFFELQWWQVLLGFLLMHYTAGIILSMVFQLAHVIGDAEMPIPEKRTGAMKNTWAIHQLFTTVNFSKNPLVNWFTGGLNRQIEHHIFPHISHIHYDKIAAIVKKTAREFHLPYHEYASMRGAIVSHFKHLKKMGLQPLTVNP